MVKFRKINLLYFFSFILFRFFEFLVDGKQVTAIGERSFDDQTTASRSTMYQNSIMVSIVEEGVTSNVEPKKLVPWLHSSQVCFFELCYW